MTKAEEMRDEADFLSDLLILERWHRPARAWRVSLLEHLAEDARQRCAELEEPRWRG